MATQKLQATCPDCGGVDVKNDAWAVWDVETQEWSLVVVFDAAFCGDCDGEIPYVNKRPIDEP